MFRRLAAIIGEQRGWCRRKDRHFSRW